VERSVQPGGAVQVYGTVEPDRHLAADRVVVVNPAGSSMLFKYGVSLVGALLVVVLFFRHWRFDTDGVGFEVR
jgi:preprotein translocase subunit SecF